MTVISVTVRHKAGVRPDGLDRIADVAVKWIGQQPISIGALQQKFRMSVIGDQHETTSLSSLVASASIR